MTILTVVAALATFSALYTLFVYLIFKDVREIVPNDKLKKKK